MKLLKKKKEYKGLQVGDIIEVTNKGIHINMYIVTSTSNMMKSKYTLVSLHSGYSLGNEDNVDELISILNTDDDLCFNIIKNDSITIEY